MGTRFTGHLVLLAVLVALVFTVSGAYSVPAYEVIFIGPQIPGASNGTAAAVSEDGDVAGYVAFESAWEHTAFVYTTELGPVLLPRPVWAVTARALDLSDRHPDGTVDIVGWAANSIYSGDLAISWRVSTVDGTVLEMVELGTLGGQVQSQAKAVNNLGDCVGYSGGFMQFGGMATRFATGGPQQLGNLYNAVAVNESRRVLTGQGLVSTLYDLHTGVQQALGAPAGFNGALGTAMNDLGQVAAIVATGDTDPRGQYIKQVWRFTDTTGWEYLFGGGNALDAAFGINNHGDVIGKVLAGLTHVDILYLEDTGSAHQIEELFAEGFEGVTVGGLNDINDARQIATSGPGGPVLLRPLVASAVGDAAVGQPSLALELSNYPNPFNPNTTIRYQVPTISDVTLRIYDVEGRLVRTLVDRPGHAAGVHTVVWHGRDDRARDLSSGVYFYRLNAGSRSESRRMVLLQ
ncbi:MAG: T9SS type A sorting domain-containing protein [Candidatus Krumholzibacteria bacterium]|nr:T9SS type A sorting domain-containing protein [Candidatus Krumholzibacteria bacterium]